MKNSLVLALIALIAITGIGIGIVSAEQITPQQVVIVDQDGAYQTIFGPQPSMTSDYYGFENPVTQADDGTLLIGMIGQGEATLKVGG
jgi:hypothetical protein